MREVVPKLVSQAELLRRLAVIRSNLPILLRLFPEPAVFFNEFASFIGDVRVRAHCKDRDWLDGQLVQMLDEYGMAGDVGCFIPSLNQVALLESVGH